MAVLIFFWLLFAFYFIIFGFMCIMKKSINLIPRIILLVLIGVVFIACNEKRNPEFGIGSSKTQLSFDSIIEPEYGIYCNNDYNYCIHYPSALLIPKDEPHNTDGKSFLSPDGRSELRVYTDSRTDKKNSVHLDIAFYQDTNVKSTNREIITRKLEEKSYIIYGIQDKKMFYQKTILRGDNLITAIMAYHKKDEIQFSKLIEPIFKSFK